MKPFIFIFIKVPHKIIRIVLYIWEYLHYRFFYPKPKLSKDFIQKKYLIASGENLDRIAQTYRELFPERVKDKISEADLICEHIFNLLGSGPKKLSTKGNNYQPIDWHNDFKSGYRWNPKTFYRNIRFGHIEGADVIVPWELSRAQHLITLGEAFLLTGDTKYAMEIKNQINDWIEHNRFGFGVNWLTAMDAAIRAVNWLVAIEFFFNDRDLLDEKFLKKFYKSLYQHGCYIKKNLLRADSITTNHYISGIAGLLFIALYCPFFNKSEKWRNFAIEELEKEIKKQVYRDGSDYEASTSYHLLVLEIFFYSLLLCERAGIFLSESYKAYVKKMFECSLYYIKPNKTAPQIGDNDSGRFFKFSNTCALNHQYLLNLAAVYYKDRNFKLEGFDFGEEPFWLFGKHAKIIWDNMVFRKIPSGVKSFPDSGWYIIRHNKDYCFISCGINGQNGLGGHAHNDKLSFELTLNGQDIIVDPGTYVYTAFPKERNKFRSTEYHNTIKFNGFEQNEIPEKNLFSLPLRVEIKDVYCKEINNKIIFQGEIKYLDFVHKRTISFNKKSHIWKIVDRFSSLQPVNAKLIFHFSPELTLDNNFIILKEIGRKIASIKIEGYEFEKEEYFYSPEYGLKMKAECLKANIIATEEVKTINTFLYRI